MTTRNDSELLREGVAIIGMSGRFPGAQNLTQFWRNLHDGVESISFFSDSELRLAGVDPAIRREDHLTGRSWVYLLDCLPVSRAMAGRVIRCY